MEAHAHNIVLLIHAANQPVCDEYSDTSTVIRNESFSFSSKEREELGIEICSDAESLLDLSLSSNTLDIGTTHCVPTRPQGYVIVLIVITIYIIITVVMAMISISIIKFLFSKLRHKVYNLPHHFN